MRAIPRLQKRYWKLGTAGLLIAALAWVAFISYQYQQTRKPVTELAGMPPVSKLTIPQPPGHLMSVRGPAGGMLASPLGVAATPRGDRVYVTQSTGERTTIGFDRSGTPLQKLAPPNTEPSGRLPLYVAVDPAGSVYVSDRMRGVIDVYSPSGEYRGTFQPQADPPRAPIALAFDRAGNFYVTDVPPGEHRLLVFDPQRKLKLSVGKEGEGEGQFSFPNGVTVDASGTIYVADSNNGRVQIFSPDGQLIETIGRGGIGTLGMPRGIGVDESGRLFIVDTVAHAVEVWDTSAALKRLYIVGSAGLGNGEFSYPNGVALDTTGRVYVTDRENHRLQVWSY